MRKLILFLIAALPVAAQTTLNLPNTIKQAGIVNQGVQPGGIGEAGTSQLVKSLNLANGGYFPVGYWSMSPTCDSGGTQTTTNWYLDQYAGSNPLFFGTNFWTGATYIAMDHNTGLPFGTGTVTASSSSTGTSGYNLTLSSALGHACNTFDVLVVRLTSPGANAATLPAYTNTSFSGGSCSSAVFAADESPSSPNQSQSLSLPASCTYAVGIDQGVGNSTNTNATLAAQGVGWINLNGSYNLTFKAKCLTTCHVAYTLQRIGGTVYFSGVSVTPTVNTTPGAGWTTYTEPFTGSETQAGGTLQFQLACSTGTCLIQDADVIEGTALSGGNPTAFRDAVVRKLQSQHPGVIRYMDSSQWCSTVADETVVSDGAMRWCSFLPYGPAPLLPAVTYNDVLGLAYFLGADAELSIGQFNQASDWTSLQNWLSNSATGPSSAYTCSGVPCSGISWNSAFAAIGRHIHTEEGNEAWNDGVYGGLWEGNGTIYGYFLGLNMAAAKAASGYNASVVDLIGDGFRDSCQSGGSWCDNALSAAVAQSANGKPNHMEVDNYNFGTFLYLTPNGSNISTTGAALRIIAGQNCVAGRAFVLVGSHFHSP